MPSAINFRIDLLWPLVAIMFTNILVSILSFHNLYCINPIKASIILYDIFRRFHNVQAKWISWSWQIRL